MGQVRQAVLEVEQVRQEGAQGRQALFDGLGNVPGLQ
jgi:hypothetical protein